MTPAEIKRNEAEEAHYSWAMEQARKRMKPETYYDAEAQEINS